MDNVEPLQKALVEAQSHEQVLIEEWQLDWKIRDFIYLDIKGSVKYLFENFGLDLIILFQK